MMAVRTLLAAAILSLAIAGSVGVAPPAGAHPTEPAAPPPTGPATAPPTEPAPPPPSASEAASESSSATAGQPADTTAGRSNPAASLAGTVASGLADRALDSLFISIGESAIWAFGKVLSWIDETSSPDVTQRWFGQTYERSYWLAATIALVALVWAITVAALRNGVTGVIGVLPRVLYVALGLAVAVPLVQTLLEFTDWLSAQVAGQTSQNLSDMAGTLGKVLVGGAGAVGIAARTGGVPAMVVGFLALVILVGALVVWLELIFRSAAIYLLLAAAAFPAALSINKASAKPIRKVAAWIVALAFAKPVIVLAFWVGSAPFASGGQADVTAVLTGAGMMTTAVFAPWALFRLFDFAGDQMTAAFASSASPQQLRTHIEQPASTYRRTATAVRERATVLRDGGVAGFSPHPTRGASAATARGAVATGGAVVVAGTTAATAGAVASKRAVRGLAATEPGGPAPPAAGVTESAGGPQETGPDAIARSATTIPARPSRSNAVDVPPAPEVEAWRRREVPEPLQRSGAAGAAGAAGGAGGRDATASPMRAGPTPIPRRAVEPEGRRPRPEPSDAAPRGPSQRLPRPPVDPRGDAR